MYCFFVPLVCTLSYVRHERFVHFATLKHCVFQSGPDAAMWPPRPLLAFNFFRTNFPFQHLGTNTPPTLLICRGHIKGEAATSFWEFLLVGHRQASFLYFTRSNPISNLLSGVASHDLFHFLIKIET